MKSTTKQIFRKWLRLCLFLEVVSMFVAYIGMILSIGNREHTVLAVGASGCALFLVLAIPALFVIGDEPAGR